MTVIKRRIRQGLVGAAGMVCLAAAVLSLLFLQGRDGCPGIRGGADRDVNPATATSAVKAEVVDTSLQSYYRPEENTYLTLPEWYIVYSTQEYARFVQRHPPSRFPYFASVDQYWTTYACVYELTRDRYEFNSETHMMLVVIGTSFSTEYAIKGAYEYTIGRVAEWLAPREPVQEELYAQRVAQEYADFLNLIPWYEFPFAEKLSGLWRETSLWGPGLPRKWERKIALSSEYATKAGYGWLIRNTASRLYDPVELETVVWIEARENAVRSNEGVRVLQVVGEGSGVISAPRYAPFTEVTARLARDDVEFIEIAGNDEVMLTAIAPREWRYELEDGTFLFEMDVLTEPDAKRVVVHTPVGGLRRVLMGLERSGAEIEHIYDY